MVHDLVWVAPFTNKLLGLSRTGMRQFCFMVDDDNSHFIINERMRARFLEDSFDIYLDGEQYHSFSFCFDEETFLNGKNIKQITDGYWLEVTKYSNDPYLGGITYSFSVFREIKEEPDYLLRLSEDQRKVYDNLKESYQRLHLDTEMIAVTKDNLPDDFYLTEDVIDEDDKVVSVCISIDSKFNGKYIEIDRKIKNINKDNDSISIVEKGIPIKEWLTTNSKNRIALIVHSILVCRKKETFFKNRDKKIYIILIN